VRKAAKSKTAATAKSGTGGTSGTLAANAKSTKHQPAKATAKHAATTKSSAAKPVKHSAHAAPVKTSPVKSPAAKTSATKPAQVKNAASAPSPQRTASPVPVKSAKPASSTAQTSTKTSSKAASQQTPRQPTRDEAAALRAFERAHREFSRGNFSEARALFVSLIDQFSGASEVAARARTYLAIAESRLRTDNGLPRDADSLYDRGVIELNRGEYVAAQEMFERALKREPEAAHIHYGLAATRARLGSIELALTSLERALELQPKLRARAQHDLDLTALRNEPDFERLVFSQR
jgi:tetratricopeptide (TPR) repeat protein